MMNDPEDDKIAVMADQHSMNLLPTYESMQPYKEGVIVSYT